MPPTADCVEAGERSLYGRGAAGADSRPLVRNWLEIQPSTPLGVRTCRQVTPSATRSGPMTITGVVSATTV